MSRRLEEDTRALVGFDTTSSRSNVDAAEYLAERLEGVGFRCRLQRYEREGIPKANVVATAGPPVEGGLIVSGHIDTVPFSDQPGWERDPLRLEIAEGRVYGRGVSDMKVFLAQCLEAARRLDLRRLARPLVFVFTADEEVGCLGAERVAEALPQLLDPVPLPRQAWIGEPTSFEIFRAHKGMGLVEIEIRGRGGHSGMPGLGVNAIEVAGRLLEALREFAHDLRRQRSPEAAELFPQSPWPTLNLGTIRGGTTANVIAEECRLLLSYRPLPHQEPQELYRELLRRIAAVPRSDSWGGEHRAEIQVRPLLLLPGYRARTESPVEAALAAVLDRRPERGAPFAADSCRFARLGIDSVLCGPGDLEEAHRPNESLSREAFERGAETVLEVIQRVCAADPW